MQEIITGIIIAVAIIATIILIYRRVTGKSKSGCSGCNRDCSQCGHPKKL